MINCIAAFFHRSTLFYADLKSGKCGEFEKGGENCTNYKVLAYLADIFVQKWAVYIGCKFKSSVPTAWNGLLWSR